MATEGDLPDSCFAWVPPGAGGANGRKSLRKLPLCSVDTGKPDCRIIGAAAAAVSPGGFRGNPANLPAGAVAAVKRRIRVARAAAKCSGNVPDSIKP